MASLDEILNVGIPALLIIVALGFIWTKMLEPWAWPIIQKAWASIKEKQETQDGKVTYGKDIVYD